MKLARKVYRNSFRKWQCFQWFNATGGIERKLGITNSKLDYKVAHGIRCLQTERSQRERERVDDFVVVVVATAAAAAFAGGVVSRNSLLRCSKSLTNSKASEILVIDCALFFCCKQKKNL